MTDETVKTFEEISAAMLMASGDAEAVHAEGYYLVECVGPGGEVRWRDIARNVVTTVGRNDMLNRYLNGSSYTTTVFMGLKGTGTAVAADTMASHASWLEVGGTNAPTYTSPRKTPSFSTAASGGAITQASASSFAITSSGTVAGCFLVVNTGAVSTIDSTAGVLFSAGDFTGGSRSVINGDTLNVTYTLTLT